MIEEKKGDKYLIKNQQACDIKIDSVLDFIILKKIKNSINEKKYLCLDYNKGQFY